MRTIHPNLFTRLMRLPAGTRADILEFLGATALADAQLERLLRDVDLMIEDQHRRGRSEGMALGA